MKVRKFLPFAVLIVIASIVFQSSSYISDLYVSFGYEGKPYALHLNDNPTAAAVARHVGRRNWQLPISGFKGFKNSDVMQYYDIPGSYKIPSNPQRITSQKAGEVYYSHPNRLVLFYHDAQVTGDFTPVGHFDATPDFIRAVEKNPEVSGYGVLIIKVSR